MASETTEATQGAEHYVGMPQLNFEWFPNQIFWLVVTLVIIWFVLAKIALPRIAGVLADRAQAIASDLEQAEALKQKAVDAEAAYNKALADARAEAGRIVAEAKAEIQKDLDAATAQADAEIAAKAAESEKAISAIRASALDSIEEVAASTVADVVAAVLPGAKSDAKAVQTAVAARMKGI